MPQLPAIPLIKVLRQFAESNDLPFNPTNWKSIQRVYAIYNQIAQLLN